MNTNMAELIAHYHKSKRILKLLSVTENIMKLTLVPYKCIQVLTELIKATSI